MSLKHIKTLALATAIITVAGISFTTGADAHVRRHVGWHSGGHYDWHNQNIHWRRHYGFAPRAVYGYAAPAV